MDGRLLKFSVLFDRHLSLLPAALVWALLATSASAAVRFHPLATPEQRALYAVQSRAMEMRAEQKADGEDLTPSEQKSSSTKRAEFSSQGPSELKSTERWTIGLRSQHPGFKQRADHLQQTLSRAIQKPELQDLTGSLRVLRLYSSTGEVEVEIQGSDPDARKSILDALQSQLSADGELRFMAPVLKINTL